MIKRRLAAAVAAAVALATLFPAISNAAPKSSGFGPAIEGFGGYEGQSKCSPWAKPGVLAFQRMTLDAYPGTGVGGISRACDIGGQSEHKEGRAWDWTANVGIPSQRAAAESMLEWLSDEDRFGNDAAMARRLGIMYMIWNRRIWFPWSGWQTYCVQKSFGCHEPGDRSSIRQPHTDHVHFSFTWDGAMKRTTYWNKSKSMLTGAAAPAGASGLWLLGRNGGIAPLGLGYHGSKAEDGPTKLDYNALAATPSGYGYWMLAKTGEVKNFGDAPFKGSAAKVTDQATDIAATPTGKGYWITTRAGRVLAFGDAKEHGGLKDGDSPVVGIASTPTGLGYWLVTANGRVAPFGDAGFFGGLVGDATEIKGITPTLTGQGYWLFTKRGRVAAFGDAGAHGGLADDDLSQNIVDLVRSGSGQGYWLVGEAGKVARFGDAPRFEASGAVAGSRVATPPTGLRTNVFGD